MLRAFCSKEILFSSMFLLLLPNQIGGSKYLVATSRCKILNMDVFDLQIRKFYHPENYTSCTDHILLTYVTKVDNIATLYIDTKIIPSYTNNGISCCYSNITRQKDIDNPDDHINISSCVEFKDNITVANFVMVKCNDSKSGKQIYENTHSAVTVDHSMKIKMETFNNTTLNPFSVIIIGIDSISRLHLLRSLPKTHQFLVDNKYVSLKGYNKIGDNTFPNVMAILSGFNDTYARTACNPTEKGKLDQCPLIWYDFRKLNYTTGYAEDESKLSTFNFMKKGFTEPPTDYYFRPYIIATEKLKMVRKDEMNYCTGPETAGERIMNIAKDFVLTFKDYPTFSFFWMNTFSHNEWNTPTGMDAKIKSFLEEISSSGALTNSFVIFLSDHGMRFGEMRYPPIGWLEERLPYLYISIPERFERQFPTEYRNLLNKRDQLTTPYDLHMTLQHMLVLSGFNYTMHPSTACPKCKSLFVETELDRSCEDAAIEQHWCTCVGSYISVNPNCTAMKNASTFIIGQIQEIIHANGHDSKCAKYSLNRIISSSISEGFTYKNDTYFLLVIETEPKAVFEATVSYKNDSREEFKLQGMVSRLDYYHAHSKCAGNANLKKYCYCL